MFKFNAVDLGYSGNKFTWARGKWGKAAIKRRLDKGMASISWRLAFPKAVISHLGVIKSDHTPILLDTNPSDSFAHRPFKFEAVRLRDERCNNVIENTWNANVAGLDFTKLYKKARCHQRCSSQMEQGGFRPLPEQNQHSTQEN